MKKFFFAVLKVGWFAKRKYAVSDTPLVHTPRKQWFFLYFIGIAAMMWLPSCKGINDNTLQAAIHLALRQNPAFNGLTVHVNNGIATLQGALNNRVEQVAADSTVAVVEGIIEVNNETTISNLP